MRIRSVCVLLVQLLVLIGFADAGDWVTKRLSIPLPGSILALVVLFLLLQFRVIPISFVATGADWYIRHLLLFFIAPAMGIMAYPHLLATAGVGIILTIAISTACVMATAGLLAEGMSRRKPAPDGAETATGRVAPTPECTEEREPS